MGHAEDLIVPTHLNPPPGVQGLVTPSAAETNLGNDQNFQKRLDTR